ncbi:HAD-IIB family hydrolase [bacterium]|nr:HAD-IIB family hydrolase [bacterium]
MLRYIFDVDGTLTPSRGAIDPSFLRYMLKFCKENYVYFATGSDAPKTIEQVGDMLFNSVTRSYNCNGNSVWEKGVNVHNNDWTIPDDARALLEQWLAENDFVHKTGNHIEERPGMVNFSIVGRNATQDERADYVKWDEGRNERFNFALELNSRFPDINATVGGETGIDIAPTGSDKSQILKDFSKNDTLMFFGDAIFEGGNDYTLARAIMREGRGIAHKVTDWENTWQTLKSR